MGFGIYAISISFHNFYRFRFFFSLLEIILQFSDSVLENYYSSPQFSYISSSLILALMQTDSDDGVLFFIHEPD